MIFSPLSKPFDFILPPEGAQGVLLNFIVTHISNTKMRDGIEKDGNRQWQYYNDTDDWCVRMILLFFTNFSDLFTALVIATKQKSMASNQSVITAMDSSPAPCVWAKMPSFSPNRKRPCPSAFYLKLISNRCAILVPGRAGLKAPISITSLSLCTFITIKWP